MRLCATCVDINDRDIRHAARVTRTHNAAVSMSALSAALSLGAVSTLANIASTAELSSSVSTANDSGAIAVSLIKSLMSGDSKVDKHIAETLLIIARALNVPRLQRTVSTHREQQNALHAGFVGEQVPKSSHCRVHDIRRETESYRVVNVQNAHRLQMRRVREADTGAATGAQSHFFERIARQRVKW
jgi:hypothetical protein